MVEYLGDKVSNNWASDAYDWKKEIVVVTGGSDGIGAIVVKLLAEKGIKVAVLDVQELTYEGNNHHPLSKSKSTPILPSIYIFFSIHTNHLQLPQPSTSSNATSPPQPP